MAEQYEKVIDYITEMISTGELESGSRLPAERVISEKLSVSRNSAREALRTLEHMGIMKSVHGSGNYLTDNMSAGMSEMFRFMLLLKQVSHDDIRRFRCDMEKTVCRNIIEAVADPSVLDGIAEILDSDCGEAERDRLFHYALVYAAGNKLWICIMEAITDVYRDWISDVLTASDESRRDEYRRLHRDILNALRAGDLKRCEAAVDRHYNM